MANSYLLNVHWVTRLYKKPLFYRELRRGEKVSPNLILLPQPPKPGARAIHWNR